MQKLIALALSFSLLSGPTWALPSQGLAAIGGPGTFLTEAVLPPVEMALKSLSPLAYRIRQWAPTPSRELLHRISFTAFLALVAGASTAHAPTLHAEGLRVWQSIAKTLADVTDLISPAAVAGLLIGSKLFKTAFRDIFGHYGYAGSENTDILTDAAVLYPSAQIYQLLDVASTQGFSVHWDPLVESSAEGRQLAIRRLIQDQFHPFFDSHGAVPVDRQIIENVVRRSAVFDAAHSQVLFPKNYEAAQPLYVDHGFSPSDLLALSAGVIAADTPGTSPIPSASMSSLTLQPDDHMTGMVGQGTFAVSSPMRQTVDLGSAYAYPCIVLTIWDSSKQVALLAHMDTDNVRTEESYEKMFLELEKHGADFNHLRFHTFRISEPGRADTSNEMRGIVEGLQAAYVKRHRIFNLTWFTDYTTQDKVSVIIDTDSGEEHVWSDLLPRNTATYADLYKVHLAERTSFKGQAVSPMNAPTAKSARPSHAERPTITGDTLFDEGLATFDKIWRMHDTLLTSTLNHKNLLGALMAFRENLFSGNFRVGKNTESFSDTLGALHRATIADGFAQDPATRTKANAAYHDRYGSNPYLVSIDWLLKNQDAAPTSMAETYRIADEALQAMELQLLIWLSLRIRHGQADVKWAALETRLNALHGPVRNVATLLLMGVSRPVDGDDVYINLMKWIAAQPKEQAWELASAFIPALTSHLYGVFKKQPEESVREAALSEHDSKLMKNFVDIYMLFSMEQIALQEYASAPEGSERHRDAFRLIHLAMQLEHTLYANEFLSVSSYKMALGLDRSPTLDSVRADYYKTLKTVLPALLRDLDKAASQSPSSTDEYPSPHDVYQLFPATVVAALELLRMRRSGHEMSVSDYESLMEHPEDLSRYANVIRKNTLKALEDLEVEAKRNAVPLRYEGLVITSAKLFTSAPYSDDGIAGRMDSFWRVNGPKLVEGLESIGRESSLVGSITLSAFAELFSAVHGKANTTLKQSA